MKQLPQHFLGFIYHTMKMMARITRNASVRAAVVAVLLWCEFLFVKAGPGFA